MIGNPFFYGAADAKRGGISEDRAFVNLFGVSALNLLQDNKLRNLWDLPLLLISAPGGGKSSIMRIFTPGALKFIRDTAQQIENRRSLAAWMDNLGAFREGEPFALGVWLRMSDEYHFFERVAGTGQQGLFCALLNSRILLQAIKGICKINGLDPQEDLERISFSLREGIGNIASQSWKKWGSKSAKSLFEKMASLEMSLCAMIDDPFWQGDSSSFFHPGLWSIDLLAGLDVFIDDSPFQFRPLIMLDDAHELTRSQLHYLLSLLTSRQTRSSLWISIRKQALNLERLLTEDLGKGVAEGRDYQVIDFEKSGRAEFRKRVLDISELRVQSVAFQLGARSQLFQNFLSDNREDIFLDHLDSSVAYNLKNQIIMASGNEIDKFNRIVEEIEERTFIPHDRCRRFRLLRIFIEREISKPQRTLPFIKLSNKLFDKFEREKGVLEAADLFLANEYHLPYYFGAARLILLSSYNVQQFLQLAGGLFEETMTAIRLGRDQESILSPERQHDIITRIGKNFLKEIPRSVRFGNHVFRLIHAIGDMCHAETYKPTASYAPGVTGTAITMQELDVLRTRASRGEESAKELYQTIESAIAHNILDPEPNYKCKNKEFLVLYLNRLLCVPFQLPLQKGGFREQKLSTLMSWFQSGYHKKNRDPRQLRIVNE